MGRSRTSKSKRQDWMTLPMWSAEFAAAAIDRFDAHQERLERSKTHDRVQRSWRSFYSRDRYGNCDLTDIQEGGKKGEVLLFKPNRYARLIRDHVTLVQQTPTIPEPMASNADPKSQDQVKLSRGICEHYKREFDLEGKKAERALVAEICGVSYLHVPWDPDAGEERLAGPMGDEGEPVEGDAAAAGEGEEEPAKPAQKIVYEGDYRFSVASLYEVAFDRSSPDPRRPRWWIVKEAANRFDMLAMASEEVDEQKRKALEHAILSADSWSKFVNELHYDDDEDDEFDDAIPVYYVYGEATRTCPDGRKAIVIDAKNVMMDGPLGEPRAPVFRLSQGEVLFRRGEATTANHDGLPLADAIGAQFSTIASNSANHGLARMLTPYAAELKQEEIDTGSAAVNYRHVDDAGNPIPPPQIWNPPPNSPELYQGYSLFTSELDLVMAGSPVTRGDPNATKGDSGTKVAALFAAAQNVGSSFVGEVMRSEAELYTYLIQGMQLHATLPRVITIVGEKNTFESRQFVSDDIEDIPRVNVHQADPMRDTLAGKLMLVEAIEGKTPEEQKQVVAVMSTGRLEPITDPTEKPRMLLERENELLRKLDEPPPDVMPGDPHREHWISHEGQLCDPEVRKNPQLVKRIQDHNLRHMLALTPGADGYAGDQVLLMTGQQPFPPDPFGLAPAPMGAPPPGATTQGPPPSAPGRPEPAGSGPKAAMAPRKRGALPDQPEMPESPVGGPPLPQGRPAGAMGRPAGA